MLRKYLSTIYINIAIKDKTCEINSYVVKKRKIIKHYTKSFDDYEKGIVRYYLEDLISKHYFTYVSLFFSSIGQGILPSKNKSDLSKYGIESDAITFKNIDDFYLYLAISELKDNQIIFHNLHIDLMYSPFIILYKLIKDKAADGFNYSGTNLYALKYNGYISIMILEGEKVKFGSYFELKSTKEERSFEVEEELGDEDLDSLNEFEFKALDDIKVDDDLSIEEPEDDNDSLQTLDIDMGMYEYIKSSMKEYYSNDIYQSDFLQNAIIFEHESSSKAMHSFIENELMLTPIIFKVDIFKEMLKLSVSDLGEQIDI